MEGADWRASAAVASGPGLRGAVCPGYILFWTLPPKFFSPRFGGPVRIWPAAASAGQTGLAVRRGRRVRSLSGAVCPGYICSGLSLQSSFPSCQGGAQRAPVAEAVVSGLGPEPSVLGTFVLDSPSKVLFTSFWGPIGASVAESESVRSSLSGAVCPGYICSERSLQNSFHTKWSAVQACPIRLKPSLLCLAHENAKGTEHTCGTLPAPHALRIR